MIFGAPVPSQSELGGAEFGRTVSLDARAGSLLSLCGLHIQELVPLSRAQLVRGSSARRGRKRRAWTLTPRCRAAPPCGPPGELRAEAAEEAEEAAAEEEELLLGCI